MTDREVKLLFRKIELLTKEIQELKEIVSFRKSEKDDYLTLKEAAALMKIGSTKINELLSSGQLPFATKIGGSWRFKKSEVIRFLERI